MSARTSVLISIFLALIHNVHANAKSHPTFSKRALQEEEALWTYKENGVEGEEPYGPEYWKDVYPECAGTRQSPINLSTAHEKEKSLSQNSLTFSPSICAASQLTFSPSDHNWQVNFDGCDEMSSLSFNEQKYNLAQLHLHSVSEHTMGSSQYDAEVHFVHIREGTEDELLVVGVLFDSDEYGANVELQKYWDVLAQDHEKSTGFYFNADPYELLPGSPNYYHYSGSLTTPPCTEGVTWIVMAETTQISNKQLTDFRAGVAAEELSTVSEMGNTNRPTQDINDRDIYYVS